MGREYDLQSKRRLNKRKLSFGAENGHENIDDSARSRALTGEESWTERFLNGQNSTGTVSRVEFPDNNHKDVPL